MSVESPDNNNFSKFLSIYYAIPAIGGFNIEQHLPGPIPLETLIPAKEIDLTLSLQLRVDVNVFNNKLNILKDASYNVISSPFDVSGGSFPTTISCEFTEFIPSITIDNILSIGNLETLHSDFRRTVVNYYLLDTNTPIFDVSGETLVEDNKFTKEDFLNLFTNMGNSNNLGGEITGGLTILYIPELMVSLYDTDPFQNRVNKTLDNGFLAGDIITIQNGINIRMDLYSKAVQPLVGLPPELTVNYDQMKILSKNYNVPLTLHLDNL